MNTDGMFARIDYCPDAMGRLSELHYWVLPDCAFYPEVDFVSELPELIIIKRSLEEYFDVKVLYGIETEVEGDRRSDKVMLCSVSYSSDENEYLQYICTKLGTYTMLYFQEIDGQLSEIDPIVLTDELKSLLCLEPYKVETEEGQSYFDEEHNVLVFASQEAAIHYLNNIVTTTTDKDIVLPSVAYVDQPTFHNYVIRAT